MRYQKTFVFLVSVLALAISLVGNANAFGDITAVEVNGVSALVTGGIDFANFAGQSVPVLVVFRADNGISPVEDVRVKVWISGERENAVVSERFDVVAGKTYSRVVELAMPFDLDEKLDESRKLEIVVESRNQGTADEKTIDFTVQRESYLVEVLGINMESRVKAGEPLLIDVVLKNRGRQFAEDTFLKARIPELGIESSTYYGDLSPVDQGGSTVEKEDAVERRAILRIPSDAPTGIYTVELEAYNSDSVTRLERRVFVTGAEDDTIVISPITTKTISTGESKKYTLTIVNKGNSVRVYELVIDAPSELELDVSEPVVVVPAGSSRTVEMEATSSEEGKYTFTVNVHSDKELISTQTFKANIEGSEIVAKTTQNTTVLLTVILAIIFVVLLVVLIVLLTRKPEKSEELSESYY
ncbi:MAG: hypothetical protein AABX73_04665 [Nanoarchaeota archaeon]